MKTIRKIGMAIFAILMCANFVSCSNDDDTPETTASDITSVKLNIQIETTNDLQRIADFNVRFTDLLGKDLNFSNNIVFEDIKAANQLALPLELNFLMDISMKPNIADDDYQCGYKIKHSVELLKENGSCESSAISESNQTWVPSSPVSNSPKQTIKSKLVIKKDADGALIVTKE